MRLVIVSDKKLAMLYNILVDIYQYYIDKHVKLKEKDNETMVIERQFTDKIKEMAKKAIVISGIQKNPDYTSLYNSMVDLFNHYTKKHELSRSLL